MVKGGHSKCLVTVLGCHSLVVELNHVYTISGCCHSLYEHSQALRDTVYLLTSAGCICKNFGGWGSYFGGVPPWCEYRKESSKRWAITMWDSTLTHLTVSISSKFHFGSQNTMLNLH